MLKVFLIGFLCVALTHQFKSGDGEIDSGEMFGKRDLNAIKDSHAKDEEKFDVRQSKEDQHHGDATYYKPNGRNTACGKKHGNNDLIVALPFHYWKTANPNKDPMCTKSIRVTNPKNGKNVTVKIQDKCGGCKGDDIDLSLGAFQHINNPSVGRFKVNWVFV